MTIKEASKTAGEWHQCKGCGGLIVFFPEGLEPYIPPMSVGHSKPIEMAGKPKTVTCALYNQYDARALYELHRDTELIEPPAEFKPVLP